MDYLRLALGVLPLGIYLLVMGLLAMRRRPTLITSGQDALLVGFALSGFVWIGPIELFFPTGAYAVLGEWAWLMLLALYGLVVLLFALQRAPGWTVLGLSSEEFRSLLQQVLAEGSIEHAWLGNQVEVPGLGVRAIVEPSRGFKGVSHLTPCGRQPQLLGWYELEKRVLSSQGFTRERVDGSSFGVVRSIGLVLLGAGCLIAALVLIDLDMERLQRWIVRVLGG